MSYQISSYDPEWPRKFQEIKRLVLNIFKDKALAVEHVGSTSVPGMKAKPLIDVLITVESIEGFEKEKAEMQSLGYSLRENVIAPKSFIFEKHTGEEKTENIHVLEKSSPKAEQLLIMKAYYLTHSERVKMYENLKEELYQKFPDDYPSYRVGKTVFLDETEKLAREWFNEAKK